MIICHFSVFYLTDVGISRFPTDIYTGCNSGFWIFSGLNLISNIWWFFFIGMSPMAGSSSTKKTISVSCSGIDPNSFYNFIGVWKESLSLKLRILVSSFDKVLRV